MPRAVLMESQCDTSAYEDLKLERQCLLQEVKFRTQLNHFMSEILSQSGDESMYQTMLEKAVSLIPGAQAGSMAIKTEYGYRYVAAVGFDLQVLSTILFELDDFTDTKEWASPVLNDFLDDSWGNVEDYKKEVFLRSGRTSDIKVSLSIPVLYNGEIVVIFNLDSFASKDAFDGVAISKAQLFATQIEVLWQRYSLEKSLKQSEYRFKQLFLEADRRSKELQLLDELQKAIFNKLELSDLFDTVTKSIADIFVFAQVTISVIKGDQLQRVSSFQNSNNVYPMPESLPLEDALVRDVLESRQMKLVFSDDLSGQSMRVTDRQSIILVLPFCEDQLVRGVLFVESDTRVIDAGDQILMMKVVEQIQVAIENARLHNQVKKDLIRAEAFYEISQAIQLKDQLPDFMQSVIESIRKVLGARWAIIYNLNYETSQVEYVSATQVGSTPLKPLNFEQVHRGLSGWVLEHKEATLRLKDQEDARELPELNRAMKEVGFGSMILAPLLYRGEPLGILATINHTDQPNFNQEDVHLLTSITSQASVALAQFKLKRDIEYQAYHDALTGLPNRVFFENRLKLALAQSERYVRIFATLFIDLDGFKHVNDTLGHEVGDDLLVAVTERLSARVRSTDTLARMGGDEFALIITDLNHKEDALKVAKDFLELFQTPFQVKEHTLTIGASIGISHYPADGKDLSSLLRHADTAMYQAKNSGKNSIRSFTQNFADQARLRLELENDLKQALTNNELELYYQPQLDLKTGQHLGLEALLRWKHSSKGFISPAQFIPVAEETKMILAIGEWVLRQACLQNVLWQKQGHKMCVAVNISAIQFEHPNFIDMVMRTLMETGLDPAYLELEVTESVVMKDIDKVIQRLSCLRALGICIAIDDFGTGYSSLQYLDKLPLDKLKIDRSFINTIRAGESSPLVETIILLAQRFGLKTLAEGIETEQQLRFLKDHGCDQAQGYYFCKPVPPDQVFLAEHNRDLAKS